MSEEHDTQQREMVWNTVSVAIFVTDASHQCIYMNPAAVQLTGYALTELQGRPLHQFIHHTRRDGSQYRQEDCPLCRVLVEFDRRMGEELFIRKDGHFFSAAFVASPLRLHGKVTGSVVEMRDITEEIDSRETLQAEASANAYRIALADALAVNTDPYQLQCTAARMLGEHFGLTHVPCWLQCSDGTDTPCCPPARAPHGSGLSKT